MGESIAGHLDRGNQKTSLCSGECPVQQRLLQRHRRGGKLTDQQQARRLAGMGFGGAVDAGRDGTADSRFRTAFARQLISEISLATIEERAIKTVGEFDGTE